MKCWFIVSLFEQIGGYWNEESDNGEYATLFFLLSDYREWENLCYFSCIIERRRTIKWLVNGPVGYTNSILLKDSNTLESFIVFLISVLSLLKDSDFIGIFYCFSNFGTILIIILFYRTDAIGIANLRNRITFNHQTPLIHRPSSDDVQCAFRCWSGLPFWI